MTVEASFLVPILILSVMLVIELFVFLAAREHVRTRMVTELYGISWQELKEGTCCENLEKDMGEPAQGICGEEEMTVSEQDSLIRIDGTIRKRGISRVTVKRRVLRVSPRLWRWQMYGSVAGE